MKIVNIKPGHSPNRPRRNIAIAANSFRDWAGGVDFIYKLAFALANSDHHTPWLMVPDHSRTFAEGPLHDYMDYRKIRRRKERIDLINEFDNFEGGVDVLHYKNFFWNFQRIIKRIRAEAYLPSASPLGQNFPIPWLGQISDFQHEYYSHYFTGEEISSRRARHRQLLDDAPVVLVNSRNTKKDIEKFFPTHKAQIIAMPFAPIYEERLAPKNGTAIRAKYKLPKQYFVICNQFWKHKDHLTAFEALAILHKKTGADVHIVCTGKMEEPRDPQYIDHLKAQINKLGLEKRITLLGFIDKDEQIAVLDESQALIQPTLFEGGPGGGAAYDAVAYGKLALVSDIPVNKEINEKGVYFFKANDPENLALKMNKALKVRTLFPKSQLIRQSNNRVKKLAETLDHAIELAIARYRQ